MSELFHGKNCILHFVAFLLHLHFSGCIFFSVFQIVVSGPGWVFCMAVACSEFCRIGMAKIFEINITIQYNKILLN
jgi:hypothetical protein